jgi:hypothetical protein
MVGMYRKSVLALVSLAFFVAIAKAADIPRVDVKIVNRQNNEFNYSYQIPGRAISSSSGNANCYSSSNNVNCSGSGQTNTVTTAPQSVDMHLEGATFTLLLPDGRMAVVNCDSKFQERFAGRGNRRSCRVPLLDDLQAEFKGNNAKLFWPVSLDGKKIQSETYKILAIVPVQSKNP